jgi:phage shock protein A
MDQQPEKTRIILHPDYLALKNYYDLLRERLLRLILEKDELINTVIPNIEAEYQLQIGYLTYEEFCLQTEINKSKRTIDIVQTAVNHGDSIARSAIETMLDLEFREWEERLKEHLEKIDIARAIENSRLTLQESKRICDLYRKLVKKLHPDVNPVIYTNNKSLWGQVQDAYRKGDLGCLKALWMVARDLDQAENEAPSSMEILLEMEDDLKKSIQNLESGIAEIASGHPYTLKEKLEDRIWVEDQQKILKKVISELSVQSSKFRILAEQVINKHCHE